MACGPSHAPYWGKEGGLSHEGRGLNIALPRLPTPWSTPHNTLPIWMMEKSPAFLFRSLNLVATLTVLFLHVLMEIMSLSQECRD